MADPKNGKKFHRLECREIMTKGPEGRDEAESTISRPRGGLETAEMKEKSCRSEKSCTLISRLSAPKLLLTRAEGSQCRERPRARVPRPVEA